MQTGSWQPDVETDKKQWAIEMMSSIFLLFDVTFSKHELSVRQAGYQKFKFEFKKKIPTKLRTQSFMILIYSKYYRPVFWRD